MTTQLLLKPSSRRLLLQAQNPQQQSQICVKTYHLKNSKSFWTYRWQQFFFLSPFRFYVRVFESLPFLSLNGVLDTSDNIYIHIVRVRLGKYNVKVPWGAVANNVSRAFKVTSHVRLFGFCHIFLFRWIRCQCSRLMRSGVTHQEYVDWLSGGFLRFDGWIFGRCAWASFLLENFWLFPLFGVREPVKIQKWRRLKNYLEFSNIVESISLNFKQQISQISQNFVPIVYFTVPSSMTQRHQFHLTVNKNKEN